MYLLLLNGHLEFKVKSAIPVRVVISWIKVSERAQKLTSKPRAPGSLWQSSIPGPQIFQGPLAEEPHKPFPLWAAQTLRPAAQKIRWMPRFWNCVSCFPRRLRVTCRAFKKIRRQAMVFKSCVEILLRSYSVPPQVREMGGIGGWGVEEALMLKSWISVSSAQQIKVCVTAHNDFLISLPEINGWHWIAGWGDTFRELVNIDRRVPPPILI